MKVQQLHRRFRFIATETDRQVSNFARDVQGGLTANPKHLPCQYFYDELGSLLFEQICELPEYYLTRTEQGILEQHAREITAFFPHKISLIELGSGSAKKTRILIEAFLQRHGTLRYVPMDISPTILKESSAELLKDYSNLKITAIAAEFREGLQFLHNEGNRRKLILWLGSSIGNLERERASQFLGNVRKAMSGDDRLLLGIDLRKDRAILEAAYDDAQGVTAQFNLNLLTRINRELGGHFQLGNFHHRAIYNEKIGRVEIYIVSNRHQTVPIEKLSIEVSFLPEETIHTENSYKYSLQEIEQLAEALNLCIEQQWLDDKKWFSVNLLGPIVK